MPPTVDSLVGRPLFGNYVVSGHGTLQGELVIDGEQTQVDLHSGTEISPEQAGEGAIKGVLLDGMRVTLLRNVLLSRRTQMEGDSRSHVFSVFPHFVLTGKIHVDEERDEVEEVVLQLGDIGCLFYDFGAFGVALRPEEHIEAVVNPPDVGRQTPVGEQPILAYFAGRMEIIEFETDIARVKVRHNPGYGLGSEAGVAIRNEITVHISPKSDRRFYDAVECAMRMVRLFEIIIGRQQEITRLELRVKSSPSNVVAVYWSHKPTPRRRGREGRRPPRPSDVLIGALADTKQFVGVVAEWVRGSSQRQHARDRWHSALRHHETYSYDRLVAAANVYDILPEEAVPKRVQLPEDLRKAKEDAQEAFRALPDTIEKRSVLGALGRIGRPVLKHKVRYRAEKVVVGSGGAFDGLARVLELAVDARNHFVHGSPCPVRFDEHPEALSFLTDSLEWVFIASELVDCGWRLQTYVRRGTVMSHPFAAYCINYKLRVRALQLAVGRVQEE